MSTPRKNRPSRSTRRSRTSRSTKPKAALKIDLLDISVGGSTPKEKKLLRQGVQRTLESIPLPALGECTLSVSLIDAEEMRRLNHQYRGKDRPTDVLSFSRIETPPQPSGLLDVGDVLICREVARAQAKEYETTYDDELRRLVVHGTLHLFGYDHERSQKDEKIMFALQDAILESLRSDGPSPLLKKGKSSRRKSSR